MRYSAVFVAFIIGIGAVITAPAGDTTARSAVSTNEVAAKDKSYIASEAKKKTSDQDSEDQSYQTSKASNHMTFIVIEERGTGKKTAAVTIFAAASAITAKLTFKIVPVVMAVVKPKASRLRESSEGQGKRLFKALSLLIVFSYRHHNLIKLSVQ